MMGPNLHTWLHNPARPGRASSPHPPPPQARSKYVVCDLPIALPSAKPDVDSPDPKTGIGTCHGHRDASRA